MLNVKAYDLATGDATPAWQPSGNLGSHQAFTRHVYRSRRITGFFTRMTATPISIIITRLPEGVWLATSPQLDGLIVEADTSKEATTLAVDMARDLLELEGRTGQTASKDFVLSYAAA